MQAQNVLIEVNSLTNRFGDQVIHQSISFKIEREKIVALIGGSGSGKTTLLRALLMLLKPETGQIKLFGLDINTLSSKQQRAIQRRWGVLFQKSALFSGLTVLENALFPLQVFTKLPPSMQKELALFKIHLSGLPMSSVNKYPAELSGGMLKRAALARALVLDPELLFLDEPTSGLDPHSARAFDQLIADLQSTHALTVVMVTHDLQSLENIVDEAIFLGDGRILAQAPVNQLKKSSHPLIQSYFSQPMENPNERQN